MQKFIITCALACLLGCDQISDQPDAFIDLSAFQTSLQCEDDQSGFADHNNFRRCALHPQMMAFALGGQFDGQLTREADLRYFYNTYRLVIDLEYEETRNLNLRNNRTIDSATSIFGLLLPIAGVTGDITGTDLGLAALVTELISESRSTVVADQTIQLVVTQMEADRAATRRAVETRIAAIDRASDPRPYLLSELMHDMIGYHRSGTMENALQNLITQAPRGQSEAATTPTPKN